MSKNLLLEIGTEEMPANIMSGVVDQLRVLAENAFGENRISLKEITVYATPRRLAVLVKEAADRQPDEEVKKRGPSIKAARRQSDQSGTGLCKRTAYRSFRAYQGRRIYMGSCRQ